MKNIMRCTKYYGSSEGEIRRFMKKVAKKKSYNISIGKNIPGIRKVRAKAQKTASHGNIN